MKEPDQLIHDAVFERLGADGFRVYPFLPSEDVAYPFVVMGVTRVLPRLTKSRMIGQVRLDVHVWNRANDRRWVSDTIGRIRELSGQIGRLGQRQWFLLDSTSEIVRDGSTDEVLYHGIVELQFKFI